MRKIVCILLFFCNYAGKSLAQNNYYISPAGNDGNTGLLNNPWKHIQYGIAHTGNFDTINVLTGNYNEQLNFSHANLTLRCPSGNHALINGSGLTAQVALVQIFNQSGITIDGFEIANNIQLDAQGILVDGNCQDITISHCTIHDIHFSSNPSATVNSNTNAQGIIVYGSNATTPIHHLNILYDTLYNCRLGYSEGIAVNGNVDGFLVKGNWVHDITNIGIDAIGHEGTAGNAATDQARNGIIKNNTTFNCISAYATSGGLYIDGAKNIILENNLSYHNGYGIEIGCENVGTIADSIIVRNNIFYNNQVAAIALGGYDYPNGSGKVINSAIQNNTCYKNDYSNTGYGELYLSYSEHCLIENNIFFLSAANQWMYAELGQPSLNFNYNNVYSDNSPANLQADWNGTSYSSFATFVTGSATNNHSIVGNPLLTAANITAPDFHIKIGSAAINAGDPLFIAATEERDMDNQFRVSGIVDCGADEYYPSTVTYTFTGNGNWTEPSYWNNHSIPPDTLMAGDSIIINPVAGGQCILDKTQHISTGATIIINPGKNLLIPGMLKLN